MTCCLGTVTATAVTRRLAPSKQLQLIIRRHFHYPPFLESVSGKFRNTIIFILIHTLFTLNGDLQSTGYAEGKLLFAPSCPAPSPISFLLKKPGIFPQKAFHFWSLKTSFCSYRVPKLFPADPEDIHVYAVETQQTLHEQTQAIHGLPINSAII